MNYINYKELKFIHFFWMLLIAGTGNGERGTGNGERGTGNGERGTGNGERGTGNGERGTGNGERGTGNGERGTGNGERGTGVWELMYSGNPLDNLIQNGGRRKELWKREKTRRQADSKRKNLGKRECLPAVLPDDQYVLLRTESDWP